MKFRILVLLLILVTIVSFSSLKRELYLGIYLKEDGTALLKYEEIIRGDPLIEIYEIHAKYASESRDSEKAFFKELSKEFYLLYGTTPDVRSYKVENMRSGNEFHRTITASVKGLISRSKDGKLFIFSRKHFKSEKDMLMFFENHLDGRFFQSSFLETTKDEKLETVRITEIHLPNGSKIEKVTSPFSKGFNKEWMFDFGRGNTYGGHVEIDDKRILIEEKETTGLEAPDILLKDENEKFFEALRDIGALDVLFYNPKINPKGLTKPVQYNPKSDFSRGWNYNISVTASHEFKDGSLKVKPGVTLGVNLGIHLTWKYKWKKISWYRYKYVFDKFEGKVSINPYTKVFVNVHTGSSKNKSWTKNLIRKRKYFTFWVSGTPVVIVLVGAVNAKANVGLSGSIDLNVSTNFSVNTSVTFKYQHGWSKSVSKSYSYSGVQFSANAKVEAWALGELPISFRGYVYNIAGPYVRFTPWIKGETNASVGSSNQVGYKVTGGLKVNGGVRMAGWLRKICGNIGSKSYELWSKSWTLKSGTYAF